MITSTGNVDTQVKASGLRFEGNTLHILLSDGREVSISIERMKWLQWLAEATPAQRAKWKIEPGGYAIYWDDLDNGIEIEHLLSRQPLA